MNRKDHNSERGHAREHDDQEAHNDNMLGGDLAIGDLDEDIMDDEFGDGKSSGRRQHDVDKDRRMFSRKKSCWFCAKKSAPDWKDPTSYAWLVNEFGKVCPSRITGLCAKHQREANTAIKRGRNMCLISHLSNQILQ